MSEPGGHLSVYSEGGHPSEVPFLFEREPKRLGLSVALSIAFDAAFIALVVFLARMPTTATKAFLIAQEEPPSGIIWLNEPGPGGGGGGGGNQMKEPPRQVEQPGKNKITIPVAKPPELEAPKETKPDTQPIQEVNIPAQALASNDADIPGVLSAPAPGPPTASQGSGSGGGAGTGTGTGIGPGNGSGLGPGSGGGTGGGVYRPGSGVVGPVEIKPTPRPEYTIDAMRLRLQGDVVVGCIVETNGICSNIEVVKSLDPTFGLDQQAIKNVQQWRFVPATRLGQPVRVYVTIAISFSIR